MYSKIFLVDLSNSNPAVRLYREGRATDPAEDRDMDKEKVIATEATERHPEEERHAIPT